MHCAFSNLEKLLTCITRRLGCTITTSSSHDSKFFFSSLFFCGWRHMLDLFIGPLNINASRRYVHRNNLINYWNAAARHLLIDNDARAFGQEVDL